MGVHLTNFAMPPPLKCTIKCCNLTGDQWICGALIWTNLCFIDISDISHTSTSLSCQAVNVTCASLRRAPPHQPVWPRWISAPFFRGKRKVEFPKKSRTSRSSRTHPIKSSPKTVKPLRKNQFQSQKLIAGCANPSSPAAVPLTDVLQQQLEIQLPDCKTSSVPFGIYNLTIPNSEERGKYKMENDFKLALGAVVCIWLWFYLDSC